MPKGRLGENDKRGAHAPDRAGGLSLKDIEQSDQVENQREI
jgi:hypothetical protein